MPKMYAFLATGMEEVECIGVCDVLARAGVKVKLVSINDKKTVKGSHGIRIKADMTLDDIDEIDGDLYFLPGGGLGTENLAKSEKLASIIKKANKKGKRIAAICAAPSVLGGLGLLQGVQATCYPGFEGKLTGAVLTGKGVITDGNITTGRGMGYAIDMGLELVSLLYDEVTARTIKTAIQYDQF